MAQNRGHFYWLTTLILGVALFGIGVGGAAYTRLFTEKRVTLRSLATTCALEAAFVAFPFALGDRIAIWTAHIHQTNAHGFGGEVWGWIAIALLVVFPAAFVSGLQFPLLIALLGRGEKDIGKQTGLAVTWNTVGAILGSLAGGFGLLPLLSAPGAWRAAAALLAALSVALMCVSLRRERRFLAAILPLGGTGVALCLLLATGPTAVWRHSGIGASRAHVPVENRNELQKWENAERHKILWEADGVESSVAIGVLHGLAFIVNGKTDGNAIGDAGTQIMLGLVGSLLHPNPKTAVVVGLGTGETAGWLAEVPSVERVDVVELEPALDEMANRCRSINHDVLRHPKVRRIYNDAREVLLTSPQRYDLIVSEPSNPYRSGVAGLFTREFYLAGRDRLNEDGLFVQWLQGYEIDQRTVCTVCATLQSVFPQAEIWQTGTTDMLLLGSMKPLRYSVPTLQGRIRQAPFPSALTCAWHATDLEGVLARYVGGPALVAALARQEGARWNTDDRNEVEYGFARTLGKQGGISIGDLRKLAVAIGASGRRSWMARWTRIASSANGE